MDIVNAGKAQARSNGQRNKLHFTTLLCLQRSTLKTVACAAYTGIPPTLKSLSGNNIEIWKHRRWLVGGKSIARISPRARPFASYYTRTGNHRSSPVYMNRIMTIIFVIADTRLLFDGLSGRRRIVLVFFLFPLRLSS